MKGGDYKWGFYLMKGGDYKWGFYLMKGGDYALGTMRWGHSMNNAG